MAARTLVAYANRRRVGTVSDENGVWSFTYDEEWLGYGDAFALSPAFAFQSASFVDGSSERPVQWFFDNLLPEEEMRAALAREATVDANDAWGLLAYYGRESAGALTLLAEGEREASGGLQPLSYANLDARIRAMPERALTATAPKRMSAAGAQQKLLLTLRGNAPEYELLEPLGSEPSMHLLKPDMRSTGYPHSAINEFFCMRLAQAMGLPVPPTHFLRVPSACYVIDRFDRDISSEPVRRLHTIDAMQLLNYDRSFKYRNANAQVLSDAIEITSTRAVARLHLFRWAIFNVLIGNADSHLKNVSFFATFRGYMLAPFYDLVSTVVYHTPTYQPHNQDRWPDCDLTMPVGQATRFADISRKNMLEFGQALRLPLKGCEKLLDEMLALADAKVANTRRAVDEIAQPNAGEVRLLDSIVAMPLAEMSRALRK
ncbi:HipA domain-containing protein [Paraburkholderia sp. SIMBA_055]|uniref:HipA N-terminal domain protein n=2 Tax=Paraburkholderia graminis TaxID=60548 RepID=B1FZ64_PARG4|nr:HipA domain-containing protein [Paraburkholderia graminis]ALE56536.1 toxin HipA [Burkholderia sp. HB1]EDT11018.1 HipA N-terminal domain protein [Paraburkholderia graminis C4D1M]MDQ0623145.1 serine/threonine-protein kinase HipA [Paraburkholderia graminis]MDR6206653.1 serine/threonine-protein kinase HipA [Paraburkholderia graminis]CAB3639535.1 Serine/threonine-protein kinase toxin HipA [Paraburkholderia graminis C4D1M]